ncbi:hypothetical protein COCC4DRAFT_205606 [Bipolaris maydis ATCC 48331]|uniref:methionyl-tRNA formyltransferase n=3 Tax=Cochliobolus heterostrophus TaxID=5016 RepID=M2V9F4_COCH5|nr:uncharacterized protein COCC4DRAFT_205606 [Bipolaris maydis ATCC 48331]EMD96592.1 hypothetical protein COCHEDRAFT_1123040 [Bipolaris maydis C5]ENI00584.1 hypothetical protein COCC4DRAFT_205606 [Bipolaris maydis ATCC 48331]KAJ6211239.1 formyl transferase [Bipolaris maydis]
MLWRLPGSIRSLLLSSRRHYVPPSCSASLSSPLRILFCGSDDFSVASLRAVVDAKRRVPQLIDSVQVLHRPAKPSGRGLKTLREVPIKQVAVEELSLPTHALDTFTGWAPPTPVDLVIAVSFGLFVPPRILALSRYGGINVHPSLLPDLRGPAPIEHTILKQRKYTGVSIQTLHPQHFDQGTILAQTPPPGIAVPPGITSQKLEKQLADVGAQMLVDVLESRKFIPPITDAGWFAQSGCPTDHAPKITKADRFVDFETDTMAAVLAKHQALGDPWCVLPNGHRLILHDVIDTATAARADRKPGLFIEPNTTQPMIRLACGKIAILAKSTYEGGKHGHGNAKLVRILADG